MRKLLAGAVLAAAGCGTYDRERLPFAGDASTPERTVAIVQHACRTETWGALYDLASDKTREKYSYVEFRMGFPRLKVPGSAETVCSLVARTSNDVLVSHWHWGEKWRLAILTVGEGDGAKDLNVLLVQERKDDEKLEWHVALAEQVEKKVAFD
ncbi:hypothetical protein HY251_11255 [bacterium]|nr:hypothetical protein [bacterium]